MLPFLQKKQQAGVIIQKRKSDMPEEDTGSDDSGLHAAAADIIQALDMKDEKALAAALRNAFQILESEEPAQDEPSNESESI